MAIPRNREQYKERQNEFNKTWRLGEGFHYATKEAFGNIYEELYELRKIVGQALGLDERRDVNRRDRANLQGAKKALLIQLLRLADHEKKVADNELEAVLMNDPEITKMFETSKDREEREVMGMDWEKMKPHPAQKRFFETPSNRIYIGGSGYGSRTQGVASEILRMRKLVEKWLAEESDRK